MPVFTKEDLDAVRALHSHLPDNAIVDTYMSVVEILDPDGSTAVGFRIGSNDENVDATKLFGLIKRLETEVLILEVARRAEDDDEDDEED